MQHPCTHNTATTLCTSCRLQISISRFVNMFVVLKKKTCVQLCTAVVRGLSAAASSCLPACNLRDMTPPQQLSGMAVGRVCLSHALHSGEHLLQGWSLGRWICCCFAQPHVQLLQHALTFAPTDTCKQYSVHHRAVVNSKLGCWSNNNWCKCPGQFDREQLLSSAVPLQWAMLNYHADTKHMFANDQNTIPSITSVHTMHDDHVQVSFWQYSEQCALMPSTNYGQQCSTMDSHYRFQTVDFMQTEVNCNMTFVAQTQSVILTAEGPVTMIKYSSCRCMPFSLPSSKTCCAELACCNLSCNSALLL